MSLLQKRLFSEWTHYSNHKILFIVKKKYLFRLFFTFLLLNILACGTKLSAEVFSTSVDYTYASTINQALGRGINLGNMFEASTQTAWSNPFKPEYVDSIANLGFDHVRMPIRWEQSFRSMQDAPYTINPAFLDSVKSVVDSALEHEMYIIINLHHHTQLMADPDAQKDRFIAHWKQIADFFKDYPDSLLFEILNEPTTNNNAQMTPAKWNEFLLLGLEAIRETNPTRIVMIAPAETGGVGGLQYLVLPEDDKNLIVTIHCYTPYSFAGQEAGAGVEWQGTESERNVLRTSFNTIRQFSQNNNNIPIHMGEFGANFNADMASRSRWTTFVARGLEQENFSWAYWEFCAERFGIYNPDTKRYYKPLVDALLYNSVPEGVGAGEAADPIYTSNFQSGVDGWTRWDGDTGSVALSRENAYLKATTAIVHGATAQLLRKPFLIEKGETYKLSFNAYSTAEFILNANMGQSGGNYKVYSSANFNIITEEQNYSLVFQMKEETYETSRICFSILALPLNESVFLKDIKVEKINNIVINEPEQHVKAVEGNSVVLSVIEYENTTYKWEYAVDENAEFELVDGAGSASTYTINNLSAENAGIYKVSYDTKSNVSNVTLINLTVLPLNETSENVVAIENRAITLSVPKLEKTIYRWEYCEDENGIYREIKNAINANTHAFESLAVSDKGYYRVSYQTDTDAKVVTFFLNVLPVVESDEMLTKIQGENIVLNIENVPSGADCVWEYSQTGNNFTEITGESTSSLTLNNAQPAASGFYRMTYIYEERAYITTFALTVLPLVESEKEMKGAVGKSVTLQVDDFDEISYKWEYKGPEDGDFALFPTAGNKNSYTINNLSDEDEGTYRISFQTATSAYVVKITLVALPLQDSGLQTASGVEHSSIMLAVAAYNDAVYTWEYSKNQAGPYLAIKEEQGGNTHVINTLTSDNSGFYRISYASESYFYISTIDLTVESSTFSTQELVEIVGKSVSLTAGEQTGISYKWEYCAAGSDVYTGLANNQNTYTLSNLESTHSGFYRATYEYEDEFFVVLINLKVLPLIESEKEAQGSVGRSITLNVDFQENTEYKWEYSDSAEGTFTPLIDADNTNNYTIESLTNESAGYYKVSFHTEVAAYIVKIHLSVLPLSESSQSITKAVGESVTMSVDDYQGVTYTWEYSATGEVPFQKLENTGNNYTIANLTLANAGFYRVSYVYSGIFYIETIELTALELTVDTVEAVGGDGASITLKVDAYDDVIYKWEYSATETGVYAPVDNALNTYTIDPLAYGHAGYYRVSYQTGTAAFVTTIHLTVLYLETDEYTVDGIKNRPVTLNVEGLVDIVYTWEYAESMEAEFISWPAAGNGYSYTIDNLTDEFAGVYKVTYNTVYQAYIIYITLNVLEPVETSTRITKLEGESITMSVELISSSVRYKWEYSQTVDGTYSQIKNKKGENTHTIENLTSNNTGYYRVTYLTGGYAYISTFELQVLSLTESTDEMTANEGQEATLSVPYETGVNYKWEYCATETGTYAEIANTTNSYTIGSTTSDNAGYYKVSYQTSTNAYVVVIHLIVRELVENSQVVPGYEGESVTLRVDYYAGVTYTWEFRKQTGGQGVQSLSLAQRAPMADDDGFTVIAGVSGNTYTINPYVAAQHAGEYRVTFSTTDEYHVSTITLSNIQDAIWTGAAGDNAWNNGNNWQPNGIPNAATNVYIPGSCSYYPHLSGEKTDNVCNYIYFMQGGEVARPDLLTYEKAHVVLNVGARQQEKLTASEFLTDVTAGNRRKFAASSSDVLSREQQWHMLSAPLKQMTSGGFAFGGYPLTFMRKWDIQTPESGSLMVGRWTGYYRGYNESLSAGEGFILWINPYQDTDMYREYGSGTDKYFTESRAYGLKESNGILEFPYHEDADMVRSRRTQQKTGNNMTYYYINDTQGDEHYMEVTGKSDVYTFDSSAYRFIVEDSNGNFPNRTNVFYNNENESRALLIGNPYMSSLDFDAFYAGNADKIGTECRIWDGAKFVVYDKNGVNTDGGSRYIAPMQSFIVTTKAATTTQSLTFNVETMTTTTSGSNKLKLSAEDKSKNENQLRIKASNGKYSSETVITHRIETASDHYNADEDVYKLFTPNMQVPEVYTSVDDWAVEINYLSSRNITVPLSLRSSGNEKIELTLQGMSGYPSTQRLYLIDSYENNRINISGQDVFTYSFNNKNNADSEGRFFICYESVDEPDTEEGMKIKAYFNGNEICLLSLNSDIIQSVQLYDLNGKEIYNNGNVANLQLRINDASLQNTVFIIAKVVTEKGVSSLKLVRTN